MRFITLALLAFLIAIGGLIACNSNGRTPSPTQTNASTPRQLPSPSDNARRITAAELHDVWQKGDVVVIDTRDLKSYQGERIKGSISMPTGTVLTRFGELPRDKMIVAYCT